MNDCAPVSVSAETSPMMLSELLDGIIELPERDNCQVRGVQLDSRMLAHEFVFIALPGDTVHGLNFLDAAIENKIAAVLVESGDEKCGAKEKQVLAAAAIKLIEIDDLYARAGEIVSRFFANPSASLQIVGVTGTDGKTSVCHLLGGIAFDVAVLTNIGRDHLDYHGDMQSYREAKQSLFYKPQLRSAVINSDDEFGALLIERLPQVDVYSYGSESRAGKHIQYKNVQHLSTGLSFELDYGQNQYSVKSGLLGGFNVQNIAATFAVLVALGISPELAADSLTTLKPVPGRMEATSLRNGAIVIVDYAVTGIRARGL